MDREGLTPLEDQPWMKGDAYYSFVCSECGENARNTYSEPYKSRMIDRRLCFTCNFWRELDEELSRTHAQKTIIDGHLYSPGNRTSGEFRGMAGRRFDIEYIDPSVHAGKRITTFDLWSGSTMPDWLKAKYPDTAIFLNGAERCQVGETGCWNPSDNKTDPYPLPKTLGVA